MDQYAEKLNPGIKALFKKYPDTFKMQVYPTRRPAAGPQQVYDATYQNATNAELIEGGDMGISNAFGGYPFPIPQNGAEAIINHNLRFSGLAL